jgi:hypothetical protein
MSTGKLQFFRSKIFGGKFFDVTFFQYLVIKTLDPDP